MLFPLWPCYKIFSQSSSKLGDYVCTHHLVMTVLISALDEHLKTTTLDPDTTWLLHLLSGSWTK
jgi:hypothetical protein